MTFSLDIETISGYCLTDERSAAIQLAQTEHRIALLDQGKSIKAGDRVLEIGCGQGDMTAALAEVVGRNGHITAVDPASLDYGSPFTLGQAQGHMKKSPVGSRIDFVQQDTLEFLSETNEIFDAVVLAQCIWYFSSPSLLTQTLEAIRKLPGKPRLLIAEYSLESKLIEATPHIHAVLTQAVLESFKTKSASNVQTVVSPRDITERATTSGWKLASEGTVTPGPKYLDGQWEVYAVQGKNFASQIDTVANDRQKAVVSAMIDTVNRSVQHVGIKNVRSMDVWVAVFE